MSSNQKYSRNDIDAAIQAAKDILNRKGSEVGNSRILAKLCIRYFFSHIDPDVLKIVALESQTEDVPLGPEREKWDPAELKKIDAEVSEFVDKIRPGLEEGCRNLIVRLEKLKDQ